MINVIKALMQNNEYQKALESVNLLESEDKLTRIEFIELFKIKTQCEISLYSDKRYLETLKKITEISDDLNDQLVLVHQLIKEKHYKKACEYYSVLRNNQYRTKLKQAYDENNQMLKMCEDFYQQSSLHFLKEELIEELDKYHCDELINSRLQNFITELFNLDHYYIQSKFEIHKPSYISYPNLCEEPFIKPFITGDIKEIELLKMIKIEVLNLLEQYKTLPYVKNIQGVPSGFEHLIENQSWSSLDVFAGNQCLVKGAEKLVSILKNNFDLADCSPLAPEVMISVLKSKTHITPHYGTSNIKHTLHIPIIIPEGDLAIRVGGVLDKWKKDKCLVFDDSFVHEAWNNSNETRVVLIVDVWHNELTLSEREFIKKVMPKIVNWRANLKLI